MNLYEISLLTLSRQWLIVISDGYQERQNADDQRLSDEERLPIGAGTPEETGSHYALGDDPGSNPPVGASAGRPLMACNHFWRTVEKDNGRFCEWVTECEKCGEVYVPSSDGAKSGAGEEQ